MRRAAAITGLVIALAVMLVIVVPVVLTASSAPPRQCPAGQGQDMDGGCVPVIFLPASPAASAR